jgi:malate dehydrogenase
MIPDEAWLRGTFISTVQQRGAAVIKARGASSAASAASGAADTVRSLVTPTPADDWHSVAVHSDGSYGVEPELVSSFPIRSNGQRWEIVQGLDIDQCSRERIDRSVAELKEEKGLVADLIKG